MREWEHRRQIEEHAWRHKHRGIIRMMQTELALEMRPAPAVIPAARSLSPVDAMSWTDDPEAVAVYLSAYEREDEDR